MFLVPVIKHGICKVEKVMTTPYLTQIPVKYHLKINVNHKNVTSRIKYRIYLGNMATKFTYKAQETLP